MVPYYWYKAKYINTPINVEVRIRDQEFVLASYSSSFVDGLFVFVFVFVAFHYEQGRVVPAAIRTPSRVTRAHPSRTLLTLFTTPPPPSET